jgi:uncharacterized protein with ATP-grasp and redox domains
MDILQGMNVPQTPPEMSTEIFKRLVRTLGQKDPLKAERERANAAAKKFLPEAEKAISSAKDPLYTALKFAALGNKLDALLPERFIAPSEQVMEQLKNKEFHANDYEEFKKDLSNANKLLYLFDNAGEIFFDKLLIHQIKKQHKKIEITGVVLPEPIFDDATREDANAAKIEELVRLIDCGLPTLGTPLHSCAKEFQQVFSEADLVIAKGQANYETLEPELAPGSPFAGKSVYFLLTVKCDVVSTALGLPVGTPALIKEL